MSSHIHTHTRARTHSLRDSFLKNDTWSVWIRFEVSVLLNTARDACQGWVGLSRIAQADAHDIGALDDHRLNAQQPLQLQDDLYTSNCIAEGCPCPASIERCGLPRRRAAESHLHGSECLTNYTWKSTICHKRKQAKITFESFGTDERFSFLIWRVGGRRGDCANGLGKKGSGLCYATISGRPASPAYGQRSAGPLAREPPVSAPHPQTTRDLGKNGDEPTNKPAHKKEPYPKTHTHTHTNAQCLSYWRCYFQLQFWTVQRAGERLRRQRGRLSKRDARAAAQDAPWSPFGTKPLSNGRKISSVSAEAEG